LTSKTATGLAQFLEDLFRRYHRPEFLSSDPLEFVHRYESAREQEAVGLICALLAYGNVKSIRSSAGAVLTHLGGPGELERSVREGKSLHPNWKHRFNTAQDLDLLLGLLADTWRQWGSLGARFCATHSPGSGIESALNSLIAEWKQRARERGGAGEGFFHLLSAPEDGSCCKRWCMYLRWMVRKDMLDPGVWAGLGVLPGDLRIPLDTHTHRISQYLGLCSRKSPQWSAVLEVTERLAQFDPLDPVKYDFALSRLGILSLCQRKYRAEICEKCALRPACSFANHEESR
jgi:uncharacterized protein (TIGR02757 family)